MSVYRKTEAVTDHTAIDSLPILMTVRQAASVGGWSEKFLRDELVKGHVKGCKLGQSWRVHRDAFLAQLGLA